MDLKISTLSGADAGKVELSDAIFGLEPREDILQRIAAATGARVIASGGAGELEHLSEAVREGGADAVLCASIFHYGRFRVADAKRRLAADGVPVRPCSGLD